MWLDLWSGLSLTTPPLIFQWGLPHKDDIVIQTINIIHINTLCLTRQHKNCKQKKIITSDWTHLSITIGFSTLKHKIRIKLIPATHVLDNFQNGNQKTKVRWLTILMILIAFLLFWPPLQVWDSALAYNHTYSTENFKNFNANTKYTYVFHIVPWFWQNKWNTLLLEPSMPFATSTPKST